MKLLNDRTSEKEYWDWLDAKCEEMKRVPPEHFLEFVSNLEREHPEILWRAKYCTNDVKLDHVFRMLLDIHKALKNK